MIHKLRHGSVTALIAALALFAVGVPAGRAQDAPPSAEQYKATIAILDVQRIVQSSQASQSIRPRIEELRKNFQEEVRKQEQELRRAEQELGQQRAILSQEAFAARRRAFEERARTAQRGVQQRRRQFDEMMSKALGEVQKNVVQIATEIATKRDIGLILPKRFVVIASKKLDISDEVLQTLNKRLPSISLEVPPEIQKSN